MALGGTPALRANHKTSDSQILRQALDRRATWTVEWLASLAAGKMIDAGIFEALSFETGGINARLRLEAGFFIDLPQPELNFDRIVGTCHWLNLVMLRILQIAGFTRQSVVDASAYLPEVSTVLGVCLRSVLEIPDKKRMFFRIIQDGSHGPLGGPRETGRGGILQDKIGLIVVDPVLRIRADISELSRSQRIHANQQRHNDKRSNNSKHTLFLQCVVSSLWWGHSHPFRIRKYTSFIASRTEPFRARLRYSE
jgi:hypothetical protein